MKPPFSTSTSSLHLNSTSTFSLPLLALLVFAASVDGRTAFGSSTSSVDGRTAFGQSAAEVVVYSDYCADGFTLKAPSATYTYPASWTGRRVVCRVPETDTNAVYEAWTGSGGFSPGSDLYGASAGRAHPTIDLTRLSPALPRFTVADPVARDRGLTVTGHRDALIRQAVENAASDEAREYALKLLEWTYSNTWEVATLDASATDPTRVRIVRWTVDDYPAYRVGVDPETVLDRKMLLSDRAFLTEADILSQGGFDLDWDNLKSGVVDNNGVKLYALPVTNVTYLVVIGDGKTYWERTYDTNSVPKILDFVIERKFGRARLAPTPVSGSLSGGVGRFRFRIDGDDVYDTDTPSYTAFQVAVRASGSTANAWTSGVRRLPAKSPSSKVYTYSTDDAALAAAVSSGGSYVWLCALYNAKYSDTPTDVSSTGWSSATLTVGE